MRKFLSTFMKLKIHNILLLIFLTTLLLMNFTGCFGNIQYEGEHADLFTEAVYSVLGASGYYSDGEYIAQPELEIIDEDNYGRILYKYYEGSIFSTYSYLICQKSDEKYVYYYPDYNFISAEELSNITDEQILELKENNDWNQEVQIEKCIKQTIVVYKSDEGPLYKKGCIIGPPSSINNSIEKFYEQATEADYRNYYYFISDDYGRMIYLVSGISIIYKDGKSSYGDWLYAVMIFDPDGTYNLETGYFILNDYQSYQDELLYLKTSNGWNCPIN